MKKYIFFFACGFLYLTSAAQNINIIPKPSEVKFTTGVFDFSKGINTGADNHDEKLQLIARQFTDRINANKELTLPKNSTQPKFIVWRKLPVGSTGGDESYRILITPDSLLIEAGSYRGVFYGTQSAIQLLFNAGKDLRLPCMVITDEPHYAYRGMELDVCRHFFAKETIKQYIDLMAQLKMNKFHWHLTDDQGWRIEIKKYPQLTTVGAWRTEKDGTKYGGFYTQADIREIVAYAQERYITIIPEIEMPGHSSAAIAAYPWLSCTPGVTPVVPTTWGVKPDIYCPGDSTFQFLKDVLDEVCTLFPGKLIHLGGDEVPKEKWRGSSTAQALIKSKNLKNEEELQHYFFKQMEDYLTTKGRRCIGWGEIVKGGISDSVVVMSWLDKSAGKAAAGHGNQVIMTPRFFCYFDYPQTIKDKKQAWWMVYLPLHKVYQFNPQVKSLRTEKQKLIMGGQANVWTEHIPDEKQLRHQVMPRLAAMAEALWTVRKNYPGFKVRLSAASKFFTTEFR